MWWHRALFFLVCMIFEWNLLDELYFEVYNLLSYFKFTAVSLYISRKCQPEATPCPPPVPAGVLPPSEPHNNRLQPYQLQVPCLSLTKKMPARGKPSTRTISRSTLGNAEPESLQVPVHTLFKNQAFRTILSIYLSWTNQTCKIVFRSFLSLMCLPRGQFIIQYNLYYTHILIQKSSPNNI